MCEYGKTSKDVATQQVMHAGNHNRAQINLVSMERFFV